jgi:hypothetical protein
VVFYLRCSVAAKPLLRVRVQQFCYQVLAFGANLVFFGLRPLNFSLQNVVEDGFFGEVCEGSDSDDHLVGDDP